MPKNPMPKDHVKRLTVDVAEFLYEDVKALLAQRKAADKAITLRQAVEYGLKAFIELEANLVDNASQACKHCEAVGGGHYFGCKAHKDYKE